VQSGISNKIFEKTGLSPIALAVTILIGLLVWEQIDYLRKKKQLPGPSLKVPVIGSMMDSMAPTFDKYNAKWQSGDLSCVSVFNRYTFIYRPTFFFFRVNANAETSLLKRIS
jgi:C-22 sterol desaturase